MGIDGCLLVIKNDFCILYILINMGLFLEFNLIVLYFFYLLEGFRIYVVKIVKESLFI